MEKSIIKNKIKSLVKDKPVRMHMPGHKGKKYGFKIDVSEIEGADNLHNAQEIIKEAQNKIAKIYESDQSFLLINGTTVGIQASILSCLSPGDEILIPINAHRSVFPALAFSQAKPIYYQPEETEFGMRVTPEIVSELIEKNPNVKAILVVSPDYYGNISDLKGIKEILTNTSISFIVDEAHGSHLKFLGNSLDGVSSGADYVIQSTHKTLGAPTQGSVLHISNKVNISKVRRALAMLESSSPSYILMSGIEEAVDEANNRANTVFNRIYKAHDAIANNQKDEDLFRLITPNGLYDKSKFVFTYPSSYPIKDKLINELRIIPEIAENGIVLFMTGIGTNQKDLNRLFGSIKIINEDLKEKGFDSNKEILKINYIPYKTEKDLLTVLNASGEEIDLNDAEGRIALDFIVPYPPGIPYLVPGSKITKDYLEVINDLLKVDYPINGIIKKDNSNFIEVLKKENEDDCN